MIPYIDDLYSIYGYAAQSLINSSGSLWNAGSAIGSQNWSSAESYLKSAANFIDDAGHYFGDTYGDSVKYWTILMLTWMDDNWPKNGITWQDIVEAWVKDDFEGRFWTIGVIDRMRQILWDEPFDLTWAARPELKEIPE